MSPRLVPLFLLAGVSIWSAGIARANNLVMNGDFSGATFTSAPYCDGSPQVCTTDILPVDWNNDPPGTDHLSNVNVVTASSMGVAAPDGGKQYIAFSSPSIADCLFQDIPTVAGQWYTLTFNLAVTQATAYLYLVPDWNSTTFFYGLDNGIYSSPTGGVGSSDGPVAFQQYSEQVQAVGSRTRLWFHGATASGAILLADVSLTQTASTPEPATLWLIGVGGILLYAWKKKRFLTRS